MKVNLGPQPTLESVVYAAARLHRTGHWCIAQHRHEHDDRSADFSAVHVTFPLD